MNNEQIINAVNDARKFFNIKTYPGNFYNYLVSDVDYIDKYKLVLFKENLGKLSGFIHYESGCAYIAINHKRPIGHQNMTLGHEIGHMFLHRDEGFDDSDNQINYKNEGNKLENEAFRFAQVFLYPRECREKDAEHIKKNELLDRYNGEQLGKFINSCCEKYFLSFPVALRILLEEAGVSPYTGGEIYTEIINKALGFKYTHLNSNFHISKESTYSVPEYNAYKYLEKIVKQRVEEDNIGQATGEAILFSNKPKEE